MAIGDGPSGPDFGAMLALSNFSNQQGGKGVIVLAGVLPGGGRDIDVTGGVTLKGKGLNADATFIKPAQAKPGFIAKLLADMGLTSQNLNEGVSKVAQGAPVQQMPFQQINSITEITGHGLPGGSSFVDSISGPRVGSGGFTPDM
jgi:hypothetical protein